MSLPPLHLALPTDTIRITPWPDPVVDLLGHDPRSTYVERFWLSLLGPSTTFLLRHLAALLEDHPGGVDLQVADAAKALGLGMRGGPRGPFLRALARTGQFHLSQPAGPGALAVRLRLPPLNRRQVERLPPVLRDEHDAWQEAARSAPDDGQRRQRACRLALSLLELGETNEATEHQLHRWKVHPALAHEALRWAHARRGAPLTPAGRPAPSPAPLAAAENAAVAGEPTLRTAAGSEPAADAEGTAEGEVGTIAAADGDRLRLAPSWTDRSGRPIPPPPRRPRPNGVSTFSPDDAA